MIYQYNIKHNVKWLQKKLAIVYIINDNINDIFPGNTSRTNQVGFPVRAGSGQGSLQAGWN